MAATVCVAVSDIAEAVTVRKNMFLRYTRQSNSSVVCEMHNDVVR